MPGSVLSTENTALVPSPVKLTFKQAFQGLWEVFTFHSKCNGKLL